MISACSIRSGSSGSVASLQIALATGSISAKTSGSFRVIAASPCRKALRLEFDLPAGVRGPRLFRPLARLAAILACELTNCRPARARAAVRRPFLALGWLAPRTEAHHWLGVPPRRLQKGSESEQTNTRCARCQREWHCGAQRQR